MGAESSRGGGGGAGRGANRNREDEEVEKLFRKIAGEEETFSQKQFEEFLRPNISVDLSARLFSYVRSIACTETDARKKKSPQKDKGIARCRFARFLATIFKGTNEHKAKLLSLLVVEAKLDPIRIVLSEILRLADLSLHSTEEYSSWKFQPKFSDDLLIDHFLFDLVVRDGRQRCDIPGKISSGNSFSSDDLEMWLARMPMVNQLMSLALYHCFPIGDLSHLTSHLLPRCVLGLGRSTPATVLDLYSVVFLNGALPPSLRSEWRLIYSSTLHGASFATMLKKIVNEGPTVLLVKDHGGNMFGGFAAESWAPNSNFYGSSHCFLFSLQPIMDVYIPTGYNSNFLYVNQNQLTLQNGLGMGGQFNYSGLWINDSFGSGHSRAGPKCTTYNSPQLSSSPEFSFDIMEVWAVGRKPGSEEEEKEEEKDPKKKSGLTKLDAETKAMLEMMGKHQHSDGLRERDPDEEQNDSK